jgi:hypothetical protein
VRGSLFIYSQKNLNNMQKRLQLLLALLAFVVTSAMAQITTSGISGKISSNGETVIGATVTATHQPSGTVYRAVTNVDGRYTIQGMRPGGPYKVSISYIGYKDKVFNNVSLNLGESQNLSCSLQEDAKQLQEVVVSGKAGLNGTKTGAAMSINAQQIADMPSISHSIADVARLNPQLTTNGQSGSMSFAGMNNRYNSFQIDGVMNNDVFGLTANGSNGGQAGSQPVSMETIDQIQVNIAPFDVRQGGFTGGAINAVTKSGTNEFHGSGYFYGNNQDLVGRHYKNMDGTYAQPYDDEKETLFGFTLGGPIIKNKLFFFANYENSEKSYPTQYTIDSPDVKFDSDLAKNLMSKIYDLANRQGYDYATSWADKDKNVKSQKAGLKLDWNINEFNKFSVRWSYVDAKQTLGLGGIATLNTTDHLYDFTSKTHSFAAELQSRISPNLSNEARVSYVRVRDARTSGQPAPSITIYKVGNGTVNIGNEYSSMANGLNQDIYTLEDNFTWFKGKVIGFSSRLNTILVPQAFMDWSNQEFAPNQKSDPNRLIVEVGNPGDENITKYLDDNGYEVETDKLDAEKTTYFLRMMVSMVMIIGLVISVLSFYILMLSIYLLVQKNSSKLENLLLIGYSPNNVAKPYQVLTIALNIVVLIIAWIILFFLRDYYMGFIETLFPDIDEGTMLPAIALGLLLFLIVSILNIVAIRRKVMSIWQRKE